MSKKQANSIVLLWSLSKIVPTSKKYAHMRMPNSQPTHSCVWRTVSWENNCLGNTSISKYHFSLKSWQINVRDSMKNNKYNQLGEIFWKLVIVWSHIRKKLEETGQLYRFIVVSIKNCSDFEKICAYAHAQFTTHAFLRMADGFLGEQLFRKYLNLKISFLP